VVRDRPVGTRRSRGPGRPLGAVVSQFTVAGTSLLLALVALRELGTAGLGTFSLLFGVLITATALQTGWIGDSLTVLDRFEPGTRRALRRSQSIAIPVIFGATSALGAVLTEIDTSTALLFGASSAAWAVEETLRRLLIARREFWNLALNDVAFAVGAFGVIGIVIATGAAFSVQTMVIALLAGSVVAIGLAVMQLPHIELARGPAAPSGMRRLASFAGWRSVQVGLRPGSLAAVRVVVATTVSIEAVGQLEAARLLIAPALTLINAAGLYLLPTYSIQARTRRALRPAVGSAMLFVAGVAGAYGLVAIVAGDTILQAVGSAGAFDVPSTAAIAAWAVFAVGFGLGIPAGSATVAAGRARRTFACRAVDAAVGIAAASVFAVSGAVELVPLGLGIGTFVGAALLYAGLIQDRPANHDDLDAAVLPDGRSPAHSTGLDPDPTDRRDSSGRPVSTPESSAGLTELTSPGHPHRSGPTRAHSTASPRSSGLLRFGSHPNLLWIMPLLLIVAIEWKLRRRELDETLAGSVDLMIAAELAICAIVGVWALSRLIPERPRFEPLIMIMWGYILTTATSAIYSPFPMLAVARSIQLVIIGAVIHLVATRGDVTTISRLLHGWVVVLTFSIGAGLVYVAPTTGPQQGRFTWFSVHSVTSGSMLAVSVPVLLGLCLAAGRRAMPWPRSVYGVLFATHVVALLATRTRGSIAGAAVALLVVGWLWSGRRTRPELVLGGLVAGGALVVGFGRPILEFLTRGATVDQIGTLNRRTEIWSLAWESFLQRPFFGLGFNSANGVFFDETQLGGAHNAFVNVMIDVGVFGVIWWLALIGASLTVLGRLRQAQRRTRTPLAGSLGSARNDTIVLIGIYTALLINGITTEGIGAGVNVAAIWLFLAAAWLTILDRTRRDEQSTGHTDPPIDVGLSLRR